MPAPGAARLARRGRGHDPAAGRRHTLPPLLDAEEVADGILRCARSPKREVTYSRSGRLLELAQALFPSLYARLLAPGFEGGNYGDEIVGSGPGTVLEPGPPYGVDGGWKRDRRKEVARGLLAAAGGTFRGWSSRGS